MGDIYTPTMAQFIAANQRDDHPRCMRINCADCVKRDLVEQLRKVLPTHDTQVAAKTLEDFASLVPDTDYSTLDDWEAGYNAAHRDAERVAARIAEGGA